MSTNEQQEAQGSSLTVNAEKPDQEPANSTENSEMPNIGTSQLERSVAEDEQKNGELNEEEKIVTWDDVMKVEEAELEKDAMLYGAQDFTACTYPQSYMPRQTLFICLTCTPPPQRAAICLGCSENCHKTHDLIELYTKRKFCCDCGNSKFNDAKCTLFEEKQPLNQLNSYNHNFEGRFCHCDQPYPSAELDEEQHQCAICEDWFHMTHIDPTFDTKDEVLLKKMTSQGSMVCNLCIRKVPFLSLLEQEADTEVCLAKHRPFEVEEGKKYFMLPGKWRARLCKCEQCLSILEMAGCDYLLDSEDDLDAFVERNLNKVKEEEAQLTEPNVARTLVTEFGPEGAIQVLNGVNLLKRKIHEFLDQHKDGKVVTKDDVHRFFGQAREEYEAKRARRDEDENAGAE